MLSSVKTARSASSVAAILCALVVSAALPSAASATDFSERGIKLFMENKPQEAVAVLELASKEAGADEKLFLYLGIAYQQLGKWDEAISAFRKGLAASTQYRHQFLFNIANSFYAQGRSAFALEYYDQALAARSDYAGAYLNRANAKMKLADYGGAVSDYSLYLSLEPSSPQAAEIRRLIDLLGARAAEAERLKAEEEARRLAEERARQTMLDEVARSLLEAAVDTTNLSAGTGDVQGYDSDLSLDD
jgi:tetratricopeptide (TPR) repeat protein